jgi:hypothetical protein
MTTRALSIACLLVAAAPAAARKHAPAPKPLETPPALLLPSTPAPAPAASPSEPPAQPSSAPPVPAISPPEQAAGGTAAPAPTPAPADDLEPLRAEYDAIRDELFRARARLGLVGEAVFHTRLVIDVAYGAQRDWPLDHLVVKVDDQQVYAAPAPTGLGEGLRAFAGFAAAGRHVVSVSLDSGGEARAGWATSGAFAVDVAEGRETRVRVVADEVGDGPKPIADKRKGRYDVRLRADLSSAPLVAAGK